MTEHILKGRRIRGLTLIRPWLWAFLHGGKRCENRTWRPPETIVGGYLALHSGLKFDRGTALAMRDGLYGARAKMVPLEDGEHPSGVIGAVARLTGYHLHADDYPSDYEFGPVVWRTPVVFPLPKPVPCRGAQGLWKLPDDVFEAVARQVP